VRKKRIALYDAQRGACAICDGEMVDPRTEPQGMNNISFASCTRDHVIPKVRVTEENKHDNSKGVCRGCNNARGSMDFEEFLRVRKFFLKRGWQPCTKAPKDVRRVISAMVLKKRLERRSCLM